MSLYRRRIMRSLREEAQEPAEEPIVLLKVLEGTHLYKDGKIKITADENILVIFKLNGVSSVTFTNENYAQPSNTRCADSDVYFDSPGTLPNANLWTSAKGSTRSILNTNGYLYITMNYWAWRNLGMNYITNYTTV